MIHKIKVSLLGSGPILSGGGQVCSSTLLETSREKILVDCGPGSFLQLQKLGLRPDQIDFIFLTHFHPDHVADLIPFIFFLANSRVQETGLLKIWGPVGLIFLMNGFRQIYGKGLDSPRVVVNELSGAQLQFPSFSVRALKVLHNAESVGYQFIINKKIISFSGDSDYCSELVDLCRKADLAFLECSYPDEKVTPGHLTPGKVGKIGQEAKIKHLVITHLYPEIQQLEPVGIIKKVYQGVVEVGKDLAQFTL
jgi:ribonuclease BN (tRNA processing enzyme)